MSNQDHILDCVRLGKVIAKKWSEKTGIPFSDLFSVVNYNIPKILPKIDKQRNPSSYICRSLTGYIMNYLRDSSRPIHVPRKLIDNYLKNEQRKRLFSEECPSYNPHEPVRSAPEILFEDIGDHDESVGYDEGSPFFTELYDILGEREIEILQLHFVEKWTYKQIAVRVNLTAKEVKDVILASCSKLQHLRPYIS